MFSDYCDQVRAYNEFPRGKNIYSITVTSRKTYRSLNEFRENLYKEINKLSIDLILEYHEKAFKVHGHGLLHSDELYEDDTRFNSGDFSVLINKVSDLKGWLIYCTKDILDTLEKNDIYLKGIWKRFKSYGKRTLFYDSDLDVEPLTP